MIGAVARQRHGENALDYSGSFFIHQPMLPLFIPQIAIDYRPRQVLAAHALGLGYRLDFTARVTGVKLAHDLPCGGEKDAVPYLLWHNRYGTVSRSYPCFK